MSSKYFSGQSISEGLLTGALFVAGERLLYSTPVMQEGLQRFGESAVSSLLADPVLDVLSPSLISSQMRADNEVALHAVTSGLVLAGADSMLKYSSGSFLYKFLIQAGADGISAYGISSWYSSVPAV